MFLFGLHIVRQSSPKRLNIVPVCAVKSYDNIAKDVSQILGSQRLKYEPKFLIQFGGHSIGLGCPKQ